MSASGQSTQKRPGGRSARIADAVHDATLQILAEDGFAALTIERVAELADVHKTTVYRRWGSREGLVAQAIARRGSEEIVVPDTGTLRGDLVMVTSAVAANLATPLGRALAQTLVGQGDDPEVTRMTRGFWDTRFDLTAAVVQRAIDRGEIEPVSDLRLTVELAVAPMWFRSIVTRSEISAEWIDAVVDTILEGVFERSSD